MARFARRLSQGRWHLTIGGRLQASDLRRLERMCAPALAWYPVPLVLELEGLTGVDEPARLFIQRLVERGAVVAGAAIPWSDEPSTPEKRVE